LDETPERPWTEPGQDPELITAAQRGDLTSLLELVHTHRRPLWRACFAITRHVGEAELLFQETLAHAARNLRAAPVARPLLPWLVRLARQVDNAKLRGREPRPSVGLRRPNGEPWIAGARGSHFVDDEQRTLHAFAQLHSDDQWLLVLRLFERLSYADIARVTGIPLPRVMNRIALAREYIERVHELGEKAA
jgi:DNA-directed RNA polymerase specialized sigma24 family protein